MFTTEKLYVGQEFKSIQALSLFISGSKIPPGNQYTNTINKMKQHFSWKTVPHSRRIIITEIFEQPKITISKSKYTSQILSNMTLLDPNQFYTKSELFPILGFTNESFIKTDQYLVNINKLKITVRKYDFIHSQINTIISQMLYNIFNKLEECDYAVLKKSYRYTYKKDADPIPVPDNFLNELMPELLATYGFKNEWHAFNSIHNNEFKNELEKELDHYNIKSFQKTYSVKFINVPINLPKPSVTALQQLIAEKLQKHIDDYNVIRTLIL